MRRGVTILEVLFSILVVSVGILGAITVFVVAGGQFRRAVVNETAAVAGRSAMHNFDTLGMRRPDRWFSWNVTTSQFQHVFVNGGFVAGYSPAHSYCIDSRSMAFNAATPGHWPAASLFPYGSTGAAMHRIAYFNPLPNSLPPAGPNRLMADKLFLLEDDLTIVRPEKDRSLPAVGKYETDASGKPIRRQTEGHYSWLATLVPIVTRGAANQWQGNDQFLLSVVVCHDRIFNEERTITAALDSSSDGSAGGEIILTAPLADSLKLRPNNWLLLSGFKPLTDETQTVRDTIGRFQWYRVTHCDHEATQITNGGFQIYATITGPDIDTSLTGLQATIVEGVVAVYEKTIRLEYGSSQ
jgi:type II secretory pathway pseudopilin PulG